MENCRLPWSLSLRWGHFQFSAICCQWNKYIGYIAVWQTAESKDLPKKGPCINMSTLIFDWHPAAVIDPTWSRRPPSRFVFPTYLFFLGRLYNYSGSFCTTPHPHLNHVFFATFLKLHHIGIRSSSTGSQSNFRRYRETQTYRIPLPMDPCISTYMNGSFV